MPINLNCPCGKTLRVPDTSAGKRAKCPVCNAVLTIPVPVPEPQPEPDPVFEIVEEPPTPVAPPAPVYKKPFVDDDDEDPTPYGLASPDSDAASGSSGSSSSGSSGSVPRPKKLPNFRIGTDNYK